MGTASAEEYLSLTLEILRRAAETQLAPIRLAAGRIADSLAGGRRLWAFGTGHSHALVEEIWGRAGGMDRVSPILEPSLMLHEGLAKSSILERQPGLAESLLQVHPVGEGDCLIVCSNSGRNAVPVEMAQGARERGATVIALTSMTHSGSVVSRAPDGRRLFEAADIVIDNCGVLGDAIVPTRDGRTGATSTTVGALLVQAIMTEVVGILEQRGVDPRLLISNNV